MTIIQLGELAPEKYVLKEKYSSINVFNSVPGIRGAPQKTLVVQRRICTKSIPSVCRQPEFDVLEIKESNGRWGKVQVTIMKPPILPETRSVPTKVFGWIDMSKMEKIVPPTTVVTPSVVRPSTRPSTRPSIPPIVQQVPIPPTKKFPWWIFVPVIGLIAYFIVKGKK